MFPSGSLAGEQDSMRGRSMAICCLLFLLIGIPATAQPPLDSLSLERRIETGWPELPFVEGGRGLLLESIRRGDDHTVQQVITFMDRRVRNETSMWLAPTERIATLATMARADLLRDSIAIRRLLVDAGANNASVTNRFGDSFLRSVRRILGERAGRLQQKFDETRPDVEEREFFNLLLNYLTVAGLRGVEEVNRRADAFADRHSPGWRAEVARTSMVRVYRETPVGAAVSIGYAAGMPLGNLGSRFSKFHAPSIGGELYLYDVVLSANAQIGVAFVDRSFHVATSLWNDGKASLLIADLTCGYELRSRRLAVVPAGGITVQSAHAPERASPNPLARSGVRVGWVLSATGGYRIPSDIGTHLDLRLRLGYAGSALGSYEAAMTGGLFTIQIGFALVYRPIDW